MIMKEKASSSIKTAGTASAHSGSIAQKKTALPQSLQETRMQGSYTFPCSMYFADYRKDIRENGFITKTHWHDAVELLHFEEGTYLLTYNTEQLTISEEAFGFIESGRLHAIRSEDGYIEQAVLFEPSLLSVSTVDASKKTIIDPLLHSRVSFPKLLTASDPGFSEISEEFDRIRKVFSAADDCEGDQYRVSSPSGQLHTKAALLNTLAVLYENKLLTPSVESNDLRGEALKSVILYIDQNYSHSIYLTSLAKIMNMSEEYFCRFFKKAMGKTPITYVNDVRMRHAALLLEKSDLPVTQIALDCGCVNMGHFISEFRKRLSCTPLEYRKKAQEAERLRND